MKTVLCIPVLNAASSAKVLLEGIRNQTCCLDFLCVIDSNSSDNTVQIFKDFGADVHVIPRHDFNHGGTRQLVMEMYAEAEILIFMTQDAILASPDSIKYLVECFDDEKVGAVCGRQLPHENASQIAAHARFFNYPPESSLKCLSDVPKLGIKAAFMSNSFAAYRRSALLAVGGFPSDVILSEDMYVAAKMLLCGWGIAYSSNACVYHSHNYTILQEFKRYFDQGVFHSREDWIRKNFGQVEGEGRKFVISELKYLFKRNPLLIFSAFFRSLTKLLGYKIGLNESCLPLILKKKFSMNSAYWN